MNSGYTINNPQWNWIDNGRSIGEKTLLDGTWFGVEQSTLQFGTHKLTGHGIKQFFDANFPADTTE